jgi:Glycosyl hydrolase catalytic core
LTKLKVRIPSMLLLIALVFTVVLYAVPMQAFTPGVKPYPLAMCSNPQIFANPIYVPKILDAGARMVRIDFSFRSIRPNEGLDPSKWNWQDLEKARGLREKYPALDWLVLFGYGAAWAQDPKFVNYPGDPAAGGEKGVNIMPAESPNNLYGNYVYETVRRYKDVMHCYESWNEPDLPGHAFFKGNGKDFFPYQRACYLAAKKADPTCTVLFAGQTFANVEGYMHAHGLKPPTIAPAAASFFEEYLQECVKDPNARANNYYFDVMNQHSYSRATDLFDYVDVDRKLMDTYLHVQKPVWITEYGFPVAPGSAWGGTEDEYCDYLLQAFAWGKLSGVERFFQFQLDNSNQQGLYDGLLGNARPALYTFRNIIAKDLSDVDLVAQLHGNRGVGFLAGNSPFHPTWQQGYDLFEFKSRTGERILMAFTDTSKKVEISVPAKKPSAVLVDRRGNRSTINAVNGAYKLTLAGATNIGGFPVDPKCKYLGQPEHLVGGATQVIIE